MNLWFRRGDIDIYFGRINFKADVSIDVWVERPESEKREIEMEVPTWGSTTEKFLSVNK